MLISRLLKMLTILSLVGLTAGCRLEIVAVHGGDVAWSGGRCSEGSNCVIEITDPNFSNSFTVTPKPGYEFVKWRAGPGFLCGDSTDLACTLKMPADPTGAAAILALLATGYLMPVYNYSGVDTDGDSVINEVDDDDDGDYALDYLDYCPLVGPDLDGYGCPDATKDTVTANGKVWAQVKNFVGVSWNDINAACPVGNGGICSGTLNGYDMEGWTWASAAEVLALFDVYGFVHLPVCEFEGCYASRAILEASAEAWVGAGWRPVWRGDAYMVGTLQIFAGMTRDRMSEDIWLCGMRPSPCPWEAELGGPSGYGMTVANYKWDSTLTDTSPTMGGWFYRSP